MSTEAEVAQDVAQVNCKDSARIGAVRQLWEKLGAPQSDIATEKSGTTENLVLRKKAFVETKDTIVLGAHYDKTAMGCGAIDNWTGIVAISHIYRSIKDLPMKKNLLLVAFGSEEQGLVGSKAMLKALQKNELEQFCVMINVDSLGMTNPLVANNLSSKSLIETTLEVAKNSGIKTGTIELPGAGADSVAFMEKGIPAVTICGLDPQWRQILHSGFDQVRRVKTEEVYQGYKLALNLLLTVEKSDCRAFAAPRKNH